MRSVLANEQSLLDSDRPRVDHVDKGDGLSSLSRLEVDYDVMQQHQMTIVGWCNLAVAQEQALGVCAFPDWVCWPGFWKCEDDHEKLVASVSLLTCLQGQLTTIGAMLGIGSL